MKYLSTRPFLGIGVIRDDNADLKRLIAILTILSIFIWNYRYSFLALADNINQVFIFLKAIRQTYLTWNYEFIYILNPFPYGPG